MSQMRENPATRPRPNVLALPSPTTARFLLLVVVFLTVGLFVGSAGFTRYFGRSYVLAQFRCFQATAGASTVLDRGEALADCRRRAELRRVAGSLTGAIFGAGIVLVVVGAHPLFVTRRRKLHPLSEVLPEAAARVTEVASDGGMRSPVPVAMIGAAAQRDAFSYGLRNRRRIALPPAAAVRWRDEGFFDHLVRHEFAHHIRGDVAWAWFARASIYALLPLLLLPVVFVIGNPGQSAYLRDYSWRMVLLAGITLLVSRALLRSREHEADLLAAGLSHDVAGTQSLIRRFVTSPNRRGWRSLLAYHPAASHRLEVLAEPERAVQVTFLDAFAAALLAALSIPLLRELFERVLVGANDSTSKALVATVTITGLLLGFSVGAGLVRAALAIRVVGGKLQVLPPAFGVAIGLVAGQVASLGQTANGTFVGLQHKWLLVISAWVGLAAVAVAGGLAHLLARAVGHLGSASVVRWVAILTNSVIFAAAIWFGLSFQTTADGSLLQLDLLWFLVVAPNWVLVSSVTIWTIVVLILIRWTRMVTPLPSWSVEAENNDGNADTGPEPPRGHRALAIGLICGVLASVTIVAIHVMTAAPAPNDAALGRSLLILLVVAAAGCGAAVGAWATDPQAGYAAAVAGACMAGMACLATLLWLAGSPLLEATNLLVPQVLTFALGAAVGVAPVLSVLPNSGRLRQPTVAIALSVVVTVVLIAAVIGLRDPISGVFMAGTPAAPGLK
jgi:Zn-dependent protease with chaperone function